MSIVEARDPLDANPTTSSVRIGRRLRQDLEVIAQKKGLSLTEVITALLKWGIEHETLVPAKNPYDLEPQNFSLRMGAPLRKRIDELAAKKRMGPSELMVEVLKLGLREEKK